MRVKSISNSGFKRLSEVSKEAQSYPETAPTVSMPAPSIDETQTADPYAIPSAEGVPDSGGMLELLNFVKSSLPADYLVDEIIRLLPPDEAQMVLEAISEDHDLMPAKELDPEDFQF